MAFFSSFGPGIISNCPRCFSTLLLISTSSLSKSLLEKFALKLDTAIRSSYKDPTHV